MEHPQTANVDTSHHDSEVEREIDSFEQNKLKDIKAKCHAFHYARLMWCFARLILTVYLVICLNLFSFQML